MPTHAQNKHQCAAAEFGWWLASPLLGAVITAGCWLARPVRWGWRRAVEAWGDLRRPAGPDEPSRAERWVVALFTVLAVVWAVALMLAVGW